MDANLIALIFTFFWTIFGALLSMFIFESVKQNKIVFYKSFLVCLVCGPGVWVVCGITATFGALIRWLKR